MQREEKQKTLKPAADLLKRSTIIGAIGAVVAFFLFIMTSIGDPREKLLTLTGVLSVLVCLYTFLSYHAYRIAASGTEPRMRSLVALTLLNLLVLGLPLGWIGFLTVFFGVGTLDDSPAVGLVLLIFGLCAVLFFFSHIMTLMAAKKIRRLHGHPHD